MTIAAFGQVSAHVRRIETVEKELKALAERTAAKEDVRYRANRSSPPSPFNRQLQVTRLRTEMKKLYDGLHIGVFTSHSYSLGNFMTIAEFLDLRSTVWGLRE